MTIPTAEAVKSAITQSWSEHPFSSCMVIRAAGRMPQLPAVGAATIRPMEAFNSETASARERAPGRKEPVRLLPLSLYRRSLKASPPVSPLVLFKCSSQPGSIHSFITWKLEAIFSYTVFSSSSICCACWLSTRAETGRLFFSAAWIREATEE